MNQIHALKANNVMCHEANKKQLLELNEANDKVIRLTIGAEKNNKMLSIRKLWSWLCRKWLKFYPHQNKICERI